MDVRPTKSDVTRRGFLGLLAALVIPLPALKPVPVEPVVDYEAQARAEMAKWWREEMDRALMDHLALAS